MTSIQRELLENEKTLLIYISYIIQDNQITPYCVNLFVQTRQSVLYLGFEPRSDQTKDFKIDICCFSAKYAAALRRKSKDWSTQNQNIVSEWSDMSAYGCCDLDGNLLTWCSTTITYLLRKDRGRKHLTT